MVKNLPVNAGDARDMDLIPGSGKSPGVENSDPLHSYLENSIDSGTSWATVHGFAKSQIRLTNTQEHLT